MGEIRQLGPDHLVARLTVSEQGRLLVPSGFLIALLMASSAALATGHWAIGLALVAWTAAWVWASVVSGRGRVRTLEVRGAHVTLDGGPVERVRIEPHRLRVGDEVLPLQLPLDGVDVALVSSALAGAAETRAWRTGGAVPTSLESLRDQAGGTR